jgi:hypothetical protein
MMSWGDVFKSVAIVAAIVVVVVAGRTVDRSIRQAEVDAKAKEWASEIDRYRPGVIRPVECDHPCRCTGSTGNTGTVGEVQ